MTSASPITNQSAPTTARRRSPVEKAWIYRPEKEWTYSHHAAIAHFQGTYYVMWSNGRINEDDVGQRVMLSSSQDFRRWTKPQPLLDSRRGKHSELVLAAAGFYTHKDTLVAYVCGYEYKPAKLTPDGCRTIGDDGHMDTGLWALTSKDGKSWEEPVALNLPVTPNHGPQATSSGRLIMTGGVMHPYSDDPSGLRGWKPSYIYPREFMKDVADDSEGFQIARQRAGCPVPLCEGSWYQTDDDTIHMLLRSNAERLWVCESRDQGETWSFPRPTDFSDDAAKFHCGRLPDGRFFHVGNPDWQGDRLPLVLSLSDDGVVFDRQFILGDQPYTLCKPGMHKSGHYGYPSSCIANKHFNEVYSRCKEAIEVARVKLSDLD
jgi:hypothetical protein